MKHPLWLTERGMIWEADIYIFYTSLHTYKIYLLQLSLFKTVTLLSLPKISLLPPNPPFPLPTSATPTMPVMRISLFLSLRQYLRRREICDLSFSRSWFVRSHSLVRAQISHSLVRALFLSPSRSHSFSLPPFSEDVILVFLERGSIEVQHVLWIP